MFITGVAFTFNMLIFMIPDVSYFLMNTIVGLNRELATLSLTPLKIFSFICLFSKQVCRLMFYIQLTLIFVKPLDNVKLPYSKINAEFYFSGLAQIGDFHRSEFTIAYRQRHIRTYAYGIYYQNLFFFNFFRIIFENI